MTTWAIAAITDDIKRHVSFFQNRNCTIVLTDRANEKFSEHLNDVFEGNDNVSFCPLGNEEKLVQKSDPAIVIVVGATAIDCRDGYASCKVIKDKGIPIVQVAPDRRLMREAPDWKSSGLGYSGMFWLAARYLPSVEPKRGAYCEFGVYDGRSFVMAGHSLKNCCGKFVAFDSYKGIGGSLAEENTQFVDGAYSANVQTLAHNLKFSGLESLDYSVVPGFFQETLSGRTSRDDEIGPISIVHIDVDVYEPALLALDYITPDISDGALLMFDEYDQMAARNDLGERRALREWLAKNPRFEVEPYREYGVCSRSFILHHKSR